MRLSTAVILPGLGSGATENYQAFEHMPSLISHDLTSVASGDEYLCPAA
jgi:hypothetical protein